MVLIIILVFFASITCSPISKIDSNDQKNVSFNEFITAELKHMSYQANQTVSMPQAIAENTSSQHNQQNQTVEINLNLPIEFLTPTKDNKITENRLPPIHINEFFPNKFNQVDSSDEYESDFFSNESNQFNSFNYDDKFNNYYLQMQHLVGDLIKKFNLESHEVYRLIGQYEMYDSSMEHEEYELENLGSILSQLIQANRDFDFITNFGGIYMNKQIKENFVKFFEKVVMKNLNKLKILTNKIKGDLLYTY